MSRVFLDTCALLFWTHSPDRLSQQASTVLSRVGQEPGPEVAISAASFWEVALKVRAGRLELGMSAREYLARVQRLPVEIVPVDATSWVESVALDWDHRDPVDRLVVAQSGARGSALLTSDGKILERWEHARW